MLESFVETGGVRLWSVSQGTGIPLVLCHGGPGCCDYLAPVANLVSEQANVIRYEQRGCGRSDAYPPYDVATYLGDLEGVRQHYGVNDWIVAGHSWGAELALIYGMNYPGRTLGLICLSGGYMNNDREWHKAYEQGREAGLEPPLSFDYPPNMEVNKLMNQSMRRYIQRPTLFRDLAQLQVPTLFIYGENDIRPSWPVEQVAHLLPKGHFTMLPGATHNLWLTHADELKTYMHDFILELGATHRATKE
ncbi:MAG: alpha/beta hydrolase [Anaerolineales bacterium]|nr:alpha/beta hydrolase [Anaerolineales bacterium]